MSWHKSEITAVGFVFALSLLPVSAHATMPALTDEPKPNTLQACQQWAAKQSPDVLDMWGFKADGSSSKEFAISRLASSCIGDTFSDLVGFNSSAGHKDEFCASHLTLKICSDTEITYDKTTLEQEAAESAIRFIVTTNLVKEISNKDLKRIFSSELFGAFFRNARDFDANWLTGTQELQGIRVDAVKFASVIDNKLKIDVTYHIMGVSEPFVHVSYFVYRDGWQWKIADISFNAQTTIRKQYK